MVSPLTETQDALKQAEALYRQLSPQQQDAYKKMRDEYFRLTLLHKKHRTLTYKNLKLKMELKNLLEILCFNNV